MKNKHSHLKRFVQTFCQTFVPMSSVAFSSGFVTCFLESFLFSSVFPLRLLKSPLILLPLPTEISPLLRELREFCGLAKAKALDDATILSLFWHGANSHRPVDLPETTGLSWREGIFRCLESVLTRAGTSLLSSVAHSSLPSAVNSSPLSANL